MCNVQTKSTFYCSCGGQFVKSVMSCGAEIPHLLCRLFLQQFLVEAKMTALQLLALQYPQTAQVHWHLHQGAGSVFMQFFVLIFLLGEHIEHWFLGLGWELCCSSIYGDRRHSTEMTKCPFMLLSSMHFFLWSFCTKLLFSF